MEGSQESEVNFKRVTIEMSDNLVVQGKMNIQAFSQLSDFLQNTDDRFVVVVSDQDGSQKAMILNKNYISSAEAMD